MSFHKCSKCSIDDCYKKFYSKMIGTNHDDAPYFCNTCYEEQVKLEEDIIQMYVKNGNNIADMVNYQYIIDYINPTSNNCIFKPMPIFRIVNENDKDYVMINKEDYNNYIRLIAISNKKLITDVIINKKQEKHQIREAVEKRKVEAIKAKERRDNDIRQMIERKIEREAEYNRIENERKKREQEQIEEQVKEEYKEYFINNPKSIVQRCEFCKEHRVFPHHFIDENKKPYMKPYTKNKEYSTEICCIDCYEDYLEKQKEKLINNKLKYTEWCEICKKEFYLPTDDKIENHYFSLKHKKNEAKLKGTNDLSLLSCNDLKKICSKTIDENGICIISNYTRIKKNELIQKMNEIYDKLIF